jgi:hypothetical protein
MRQHWRVLVGLALTLSALSALLGAFLLGAAAVGLDVRNLPAFLAESKEASDRGRRLDELDQEALSRTLEKYAVAEQVLDGRLTVEEGAARFGALSATMPEDQRRVWRKYTPGDSDEERYRNSLLRFVEVIRDDRARGGVSGPGRRDAPGPG